MQINFFAVQKTRVLNDLAQILENCGRNVFQP